MSTYTARSAKNWPCAKCPDFTTKDKWHLNSPDLNLVEYHMWGAVLKAYRKLKTKSKTFTELKKALEVIRGNLPGSD